MKNKLKFSICLLIFFLINFRGSLICQEIPILVISPSKKPQSISTVGSDVIILEEKFLEESNEYFLGDLLSNTSTSANFFQTGGHGATSALQIRGLPKRYTTVFVDGVRMSDPSSVSNDFDFNHILTSHISRVEILKGNQSSIYGSGAIGGTINIITKKYKLDKNKSFSYTTGSNNTHNLALSYSMGDKKNNIYFGAEKFQTDGISQMSHNDEKDSYKNNSIFINYGKELFKNITLDANMRVADTYLQYDKEINTDDATHSEEEKGIQSSSGFSFTHIANKKLKNKLTFGKTYIKRIYNAAPGSGNLVKDTYAGDRNSFSYKADYNFNLDNSVIFGIESEKDLIKYNKDLTGISEKSYVTLSNYIDFQSRLTKNLFATLGSRLSDNSIAGDEEAHRVTLAFLTDNKNSKYRSSFGTGFRYPSLYEMYYVYGSNSASLPYVKAEKSTSFDIGFDKNFSNDKNLSLTYFNINYRDALEGWESNVSSGSSYTTQNTTSKVKSQGLELSTNWKQNNYLNFSLNYTYTSTYDGAEADDPNRNQNYTNNQIVRVPRHLINLQTNFKLPKFQNLSFKINTKWSDNARDYGNGNRTYADERTSQYLVNDFFVKYKLKKNYDIFFNIVNVLDEKYETAKDYSQMDRSFNIGIKKVY